MKKSLYLIAGILIGITLFGGSSVLAAGITAERSTNRIYVDGQEVHLTAYNINGNNYVMLRDVGRTVGFNVYWNSDAKCVQVHRRSAGNVCGGKARGAACADRCRRCKAGHH